MNQKRLINNFYNDALHSKLNTTEMIEKYFYKPDEILVNSSEMKLLIYEANFLFFKRYLTEGTGYVYVNCGLRILNSRYFDYLFDTKTFNQIVSLYYYNKKYKYIDTLSFFFLNDKIYSVLPFDNHHGGAFWDR